jgi:hypothetical protein
MNSLGGGDILLAKTFGVGFVDWGYGIAISF